MSEDISEEDDIECDDTLIEHNTANQPQFHVVQPNGNMLPYEGRRPGSQSSRSSSFRRYQSLDLNQPSAMDDATSSDNELGGQFSRNDRCLFHLFILLGFGMHEVYNSPPMKHGF